MIGESYAVAVAGGRRRQGEAAAKAGKEATMGRRDGGDGGAR